MKSFGIFPLLLATLFVSKVSSQSLFQHFARSLQAMHHDGHHHGENYRKESHHHGKYGKHHKKKDCNKHKQADGESHEHGEGMMVMHGDHHHHHHHNGNMMGMGSTSSLRGSSSSSSSSSSTSPSMTSKSQSSLSTSSDEEAREASASYSLDKENEKVIEFEEFPSEEEEDNYEEIFVDMEESNEQIPDVEGIVDEGADVMEEVMEWVDEVVEETRSEPIEDSIMSVDQEEEEINGDMEYVPEAVLEQEEPVLVREEEETNGSMVDLEDGLSNQMFAKLLVGSP